ncbi:MAG: MBOAT family protein [Christensenellaceae bacterium]|jgi:alginate O-acetyltransferase complex protein AlgI|nr:MBOAT family protein [Christensenellaceae bacterium]
MLFSSLTFLYFFLPAVLVLYFLVLLLCGGRSIRPANLVLLLASLVFYAWGEPVYVFLMAGQTFAAWLFGLIIERFRGARAGKTAFALSCALTLSGLLFFKYSDFFLSNFAALTSSPIRLLGLALPLGISFYSFQILSYTIDLYRGKTAVQRDFFAFAAYVMLFPQLVAGPIVRYADVAAELGGRKHDWAGFSAGARRFVLGLGKKVLLANVLGELVAAYHGSAEQSLLFAWLYAVAYALHIYFDFSGYSDMAIGLGAIFGFHFLENFDYPLVSRSITEFWRRWHISLSSWLRDYVYIPLGGNRVALGRWILNTLAVWMLTGFWHGAGWNFILWGLYFGLLLLAEKFFVGRLIEKLPRFFGHFYALFIVSLSWMLFDAQGLGESFAGFTVLLGFGARALAGPESLYALRNYALPLLIGAVGCTPYPRLWAQRLQKSRLAPAMPFLEGAFIAALLLLVTAYLVDGSFNPFIYFRF